MQGWMVCTERVEVAAVSRGASSVTTKQRCKYATWVDIQETRAQNNNNKQLQPLIEN